MIETLRSYQEGAFPPLEIIPNDFSRSFREKQVHAVYKVNSRFTPESRVAERGKTGRMAPLIRPSSVEQAVIDIGGRRGYVHLLTCDISDLLAFPSISSMLVLLWLLYTRCMPINRVLIDLLFVSIMTFP